MMLTPGRFNRRNKVLNHRQKIALTLLTIGYGALLGAILFHLH